MLPAESGLILSRNTMTVRVGMTAGLPRVERIARAVGFKLPENPTPVCFLGTFGATPLAVTEAFGVLAAGGVKHQTYVIERIDDSSGEIIYRAAHLKTVPMTAAACRTMTGVLAEVFERGTAASARALGWKAPSAGKTGTTDDYNDAWFMGYTESLTCGVWVGLDRPATIVPKGYGATLALPIWVDVMLKAAPEKYPLGPIRSSDYVRAVPPQKRPPNSDSSSAQPRDQGPAKKSFLDFFRN
jgi:penicillin-binding protein 1A